MLNTTTSNSFSKYEDQDLGFSLEYPSNWEVGSGSNAYQIVSFSSPDNTASAYIYFKPREDDETLKNFGDEFVKENEDFRFNEYYRNSTTLLADHPAIRASGTYFNTITNLEASLGYKSSATKTLQVMTLDENNDGFIGVIFHADDQPSYDKYVPLVEHMIDSFGLSASGPIISEEG
ncbi:MAG: PsbP-related protein [Candidatus Nitrosocosmicus sp.]|nr:PsbP-related protein [Candidatus Nitrosocosmicus sp.]